MYSTLRNILSAVLRFLTFIGFKLAPHEKGKSLSVSRNKYGSIKENFEEKFDFQKINTVEISLESTADTTVTVEANGEKVYERTGSENYRFCAFKTIETDKIKVTVSPKAKIKDVRVSLKTSNDKDFRVTAYFRSDYIQRRSDIDEKFFDIITDAILISGVTYDENGNITIDEPIFETAHKNLRDAIGKRKVNVHLTFLGPGPDSGISDWKAQMKSLSEKNSKAFLNPKLITGINEVIEKYGFDGIFFDYEYPIKRKYWADFEAFLKKLSLSTDKKIGLAVSCWNILIGKSGIDTCDMFEFMQYDRFDKNGNHAPFSLAPETVERARAFSVDRKKVDFGVPFYARPTDAAGVWLEYRDYAEKLGFSRDDTEAQCGKVYFNSCQTIYDKTAYALAYDLGGMMVWHFNSDIPDAENPLSLFKAIGDCIADRNVKIQ